MKTRIGFVMTIAAVFVLPVTLMVACKSQLSSGNSGPRSGNRLQGPCDIYAAGGTPCVAAHSTTRALYASYHGPLYQVVRQSDGRTLDIGLVRPSATDAGGYADAAAQDAFCAGTLCFIKEIYDQSGKGNHLYQAPPGTFKGPDKGAFNTLPIADMAPISIAGHKAYGVFIMPGMGFRNNNAVDIAINDEPEGIYYVVDGTHYDSGCCFDYGNSSANSKAVGTGTMETVYFGTATAWGSGDGNGPWIMTDLEAGLFTGYNAKRNAGAPTVDSWRFVTAVVDGGGGNQWDLRGGNAQLGNLTTYYKGIRPGSSNNAAYFPMHKKGGILLGNGGDNGNGSSGTFYEGVMTTGFPTEATTDALQANIVAAKYDTQRVGLSRATTFTPGSSQDVTVTFKNTSGVPATGVNLSVLVPGGWTTVVSGTADISKNFVEPIAPGASVSATFKITSSSTPGSGFLTAHAGWSSSLANKSQTDAAVQRARNAFPVKLNEVRLSGGANSSDQFIELYNASDREVDISRWSLNHTASQWAPVKIATIPAGTKIAAKGFYLLGLSGSGLAAPAAPLTTLFIPVSTGPWLTVPVGATNLPVTSAVGFEVGQNIGIDHGGNYESATVTAVGKAGTQTTILSSNAVGDTHIKLAANSDITVGDTIIVGTGRSKEFATVKSIITVSATPSVGGARGFGGGGPGAGGEIELAAPLKFAHPSGVDVSDVGTGISFSPPLSWPHVSGEAVQALGSGITNDRPLAQGHEFGASVNGALTNAGGYQGAVVPNQWFGTPLSATAGSLALVDARGKLIVDALVYGSRQSSSSANGTITSPELATLEGVQTQGGCIIVVPSGGRGGGAGRGAAPGGNSNRSIALTTDGADTDNNCSDYQLQTPTPGAPNQKTQ